MPWKTLFWFLPRLLITSLGLICAGLAFLFALGAVFLQGLSASISGRR